MSAPPPSPAGLPPASHRPPLPPRNLAGAASRDPNGPSGYITPQSGCKLLSIKHVSIVPYLRPRTPHRLLY